MYFSLFEVEAKQFREHDPIGEIAYISASPTSRQIVRSHKVGQRGQWSKRRSIPLRRPIDAINLLFPGISLLLGLTLMGLALKLLIKLKDYV